MKDFIYSVFILLLFSTFSYSQETTVEGIVNTNGTPVPFANIIIPNTNKGTSTDIDGKFSISLTNQPTVIRVQSIGFTTFEKTINPENYINKILEIELKEDQEALEQIVITGTRTPKRKTDSPVIVNLINSETLDRVVATDLSEGLRFQTGLRVEKDCQTCNYTQLRMNGLKGEYSQILINGRAIFSPLTGLYGLEQIPPNMIDRIEVVRGGVSALYGSSAIGGTVNVITKVPRTNNYSVRYIHELIDSNTNQTMLTGNATVVNELHTAGANFFATRRERDAYDANGDNFSEMPSLKNNSFGLNSFFLPTENSKLEFSLSSLYEYRYGGELTNLPAHLAQQSEERTHNVLMGSIDYQVNFNENKNSFIIYYGGQTTDRDHFTGIIPDNEEERLAYLEQPPYGTSEIFTHQGGMQLNNKIENFLKGSTVVTVGAEYIYDDVYDEIPSYNYLVDQTTKNIGVFVQNDWEISEEINFLSGFRLDKHNLVEHIIFSPRLSLLYKLKETTQFRLGWGTGFRAPQAFDSDLHIAFAGGGVSRISLAENLTEERSNSFTASVNYDKANEHFIGGFTLEGFYTYLDDAFYLEALGEDEFGERFEKRNGTGATVKGITLEARANFDYLVEVEAGFTIQSSRYDDAVLNIEGLAPEEDFLRTPNHYGYAILNYSPGKNFEATANLIYTGSMNIAHFGGIGTGQAEDEYVTTPAFTEIGLRFGYNINLEKFNTDLELFTGVKNLTNNFQDDFDIGKNRDSNYIYGPLVPRTFFAGLALNFL